MPLRTLSWAPVVPDRFRYDGLPGSYSIRLLELLGIDRTTERLHCRLQAEFLGDCPPFDALSYSWKDPILTDAEVESLRDDPDRPDSFHEIICNGYSQLISENLYQALYQLCRSGHRRPLWTDALCINQLALDERAEQVAMMGDIYATAARVIVWLGPETPDIPNVLWIHTEFFQVLERMAQRIGFEKTVARSPLDKNFLKDLGLDIPLIEWYHRWWSYFEFFRRRRWFYRAWIVQEVALAREVQVLCGSVELPWNAMWALARIVCGSGWAQSLAPMEQLRKQAGLGELDGIWLMQSVYRADGPFDTNTGGFRYRNGRVWGARTDEEFWCCYLMWAMSTIREQEAKYAVDHVYAILGIVNRFWPEDRPKLVVPDYELSPQDVFRDVAGVLLTRIPLLALLSEVEHDIEKEDPGLPSWVPDWSAPGCGMVRFGWSVVQGIPVYDSSLVTSFNGPACVIRGTTLRVCGAVFDSVAEVGEITNIMISSHWIMPCIDMCKRMDKVYPTTGQGRQEVLWRTMVANQLGEHEYPAPAGSGLSFRDWARINLALGLYKRQSNGEPCAQYLESLSCLDSFCPDEQPSLLPSKEQVVSFANVLESGLEKLGIDDSDEILDFIKEGEGRSTEYGSRISTTGGSRRLYRTTQGFLGLGPDSIKKGDIVCMIQGGRVPYILRKHAVRSGWKLVGEAYLHGFMHGEMVAAVQGTVEEMDIV
ncbi:heterokaryon incompatibility protein-domain-containing protein [Macrophomina phaseolina]|uniref:Heterokaryon incompatibility protein-domain-containing protein n=1 Tax=Macrophomina phaseolina TaxID=35725 RepID=A0ABQ8GTF1_9PEZI|nr:heterokaryon incompatibility protein-domain-containing protein [Macrophomina phaseolina]